MRASRIMRTLRILVRFHNGFIPFSLEQFVRRDSVSSVYMHQLRAGDTAVGSSRDVR
jgi:hypothetical protein